VSQQELLKRVVVALRDAGIRYMLTGSVVSSLQGEPRSSHDLDLVVEMRPGDVAAVAAAFADPHLFLDTDAATAALQRSGMFQLIDTATGDKVDFWPLTDEPFDRSRFGRRVTFEVWGVPMQVSAPEDTILMKLKWAADLGGSEKQQLDALRVYEVQGGTLDQDYLAAWAARLGISDALARVGAEARGET
jgi:hypothetical protein